MGLPALFVWGCSGQKPVLRISVRADGLKPELKSRFEKAFHCKVVEDPCDSNEALYAKLKAGASGYDLLVPSSTMVTMMHGQGMLQPVRHALIPNLKYIDPKILALTGDMEMHHGVPYLTRVTGIGYIDGKVSRIKPSWSMFERSELAGRITLLDDMRETIGAALKYLGYSMNTTDVVELGMARDVVIGWKRNIARFESDHFNTGLASEDFLLVHGYRADILRSMKDNKNVTFFVPREGSSVVRDDFCIPADADQVELAHQFINFLLDPKVAAENIEYVYFLAPKKPANALPGEKIKKDPAVFTPPEIPDKCEVIRDLGEDNAKYKRIWDEIKAAN